jgi:hypothetical protein
MNAPVPFGVRTSAELVSVVFSERVTFVLTLWPVRSVPAVMLVVKLIAPPPMLVSTWKVAPTGLTTK